MFGQLTQNLSFNFAFEIVLQSFKYINILQIFGNVIFN